MPPGRRISNEQLVVERLSTVYPCAFLNSKYVTYSKKYNIHGNEKSIL